MGLIRKYAIIAALFTLILPVSEMLLLGQAKQMVSPSNGAAQVHWKGSDCSALLSKLDRDRDGFISKREWEFFFINQDENEDQLLSPGEIQKIAQQVGGPDTAETDSGRLAAFERLDASRNGRIDPTEWPGKATDFRYLDADHDGYLSREEFLSKRGRWYNELFDNLDLNGDGVIARSEWLDSMASFDRLDRDFNGALDRSEFYTPR